ncbi:MAG: DNA repair protein RecO [Rhodocyclaceae bacterium]|nr:DNA repair protein RecO [Rhodocyclaceae bacterium]
MSGRNRVDGAAAYVLHSHPYRETSLIVEAFSRDHGRVGLVARGARRPHSQLRGLLMAFAPLELSWFGGGEVRTLAKAEWQGGQPLLTGQALLVGYYLNELLLRLLPRDDAHPGLFQAYGEVVRQLALSPDSGGAASLRRFELTLLQELGYGVSLEHEAEGGEAVVAEGLYAYLPERGPVRVADAEAASPLFTGKALLAMARDDYADAETLHQAKTLMRHLLGHTLGGQALHTRRVFMEMQEL